MSKYWNLRNILKVEPETDTCAGDVGPSTEYRRCLEAPSQENRRVAEELLDRMDRQQDVSSMEFKELAEALLCGRKHNNAQGPWASQGEELADEWGTMFRDHVEITGRRKQKVASCHPKSKSALEPSYMDDMIKLISGMHVIAANKIDQNTLPESTALLQGRQPVEPFQRNIFGYIFNQVPENTHIDDTKSVNEGVSAAEVERNLGKQTPLDNPTSTTSTRSTKFCFPYFTTQPLKVIFIFTAGGSAGRGDTLSRVSGARDEHTMNGYEFWKSIPSRPYPSKYILINGSTLASNSKTLLESNLPTLEPFKPITSKAPNSVPETSTQIDSLCQVFDSVHVQPNLPRSPSSLNQESQGVIPQNMPVVPSASRVEIPPLSPSLLEVEIPQPSRRADRTYWLHTGEVSAIVASGMRLNKKIPYKGKTIKVCLPENVNMVQNGEALKPMRNNDAERKFDGWDYDTAVPIVKTVESQSCGLWPRADDTELEGQSRSFRVVIPSPDDLERMSISPFKFNDLVFTEGDAHGAEAQLNDQFDTQERISGSSIIGRPAEPTPSKGEARVSLPREITTEELKSSCQLDAEKEDSLLNDPILSEPPNLAQMPDTLEQEPLPMPNPTGSSDTISTLSADDKVEASIQIQDFTSGLEIPLQKASEPAVEAPTSSYPPDSLLPIEIQSHKTSPDLVNSPSPEISDSATLPAMSSHKEMSPFNLDFMPPSPSWKVKIEDSTSITSKISLRIIGKQSGFVFGAERKVPPKSFDYDTWSKLSYAARLPDKISFRDELGTEMGMNSKGDTEKIQELKEDLLWKSGGLGAETAVESENELLIGRAPTTAGKGSVSHHDQWKVDSKRPKTPVQTSQTYPNEEVLTTEATPEPARLSNHVSEDASNPQSTPGIEEESDASSIPGENDYLAPEITAERELVSSAAGENIFGNVVIMSTQSYQMHLPPDRADTLPTPPESPQKPHRIEHVTISRPDEWQVRPSAVIPRKPVPSPQKTGPTPQTVESDGRYDQDVQDEESYASQSREQVPWEKRPSDVRNWGLKRKLKEFETKAIKTAAETAKRVADSLDSRAKRLQPDGVDRAPS